MQKQPGDHSDNSSDSSSGIQGDKECKAWIDWLNQFGTVKEREQIAKQIQETLQRRSGEDYSQARNSVALVLRDLKEKNGDLPLWGNY